MSLLKVLFHQLSTVKILCSMVPGSPCYLCGVMSSGLHSVCSLVSICFSILGIASFLACFCFILNIYHLPWPPNQHYITRYNYTSYNRITNAFICIPPPSFLLPFLFLFYFSIESFRRYRQVWILRHILVLFSYTKSAYYIDCTLPYFSLYHVLEVALRVYVPFFIVTPSMRMPQFI